MLQRNSWRRAAARCIREEYTCSRSSCVWAYGLVLTRDRRRSSTPREGLHLFDSAPPPQRSTQTRTPLWPDIAAQAHAAVHHASFCRCVHPRLFARPLLLCSAAPQAPDAGRRLISLPLDESSSSSSSSSSRRRIRMTLDFEPPAVRSAEFKQLVQSVYGEGTGAAKGQGQPTFLCPPPAMPSSLSSLFLSCGSAS